MLSPHTIRVVVSEAQSVDPRFAVELAKRLGALMVKHRVELAVRRAERSAADLMTDLMLDMADEDVVLLADDLIADDSHLPWHRHHAVGEIA